MRWFSWLFGKKEEPPEPPEPLVLGAKLHCPYGSNDSYLYVDSEDFEVNNLPKACVEDCKALYNIQPFGNCHGTGGGPCEYAIDLDEKWENPEQQGEKINGKEIITTKSLLSCRVSGIEFEIINSGQDGIYAKQLLLIMEMDKKYPGLREILDDPNGSLYLNEGKYEIAIQFIEDRMEQNGGEIEFSSLFDIKEKDNLELAYIKGALERLLTNWNMRRDLGCNLLPDIDDLGRSTEMDLDAKWDPMIINVQMIKAIRKECKKRAKSIEKEPIYRWQEKTKLLSSVLAEGVTNFTYGILMYYSATGGARNKQPANKDVNEGSVSNKGVSNKKTAAAENNSEGVGTEGTGKGIFNGVDETALKDTVKEHVFSKKHLKSGIADLGVSEDDILNKGFNTLKEMDGKGLIKDGPTQIKTHINGMEAEIKIYIKDGEIISFDMFKGWSVRDMGNTIYY